jgi:hypothetical protein
VELVMIIRILNCVLLMLVAVPCFGQEITVRVVNAADGHPLKRVSISVRAMAAGEHNLRLVTDDNGVAKFTLPQPAPTHFTVDVLISPTHWDCPCIGGGYTDEVIQKGIVVAPGKTSGVASLKATPGQILIPVRPLSFFERIYMSLIGR